MATCNICGEPIQSGSQTCSLCGSRLEEFFPAATGLHAATPSALASAPTSLPSGGSWCPSCAKVYGPVHLDPFCECGTELLKDLPAASMYEDVPMAPVLDDELPMAPVLDDEPAPDLNEPGTKPPPGTPCIVIYGSDKRPLRYFALEKDATVIGRLDAVAGNFPDIDLEEWFDRSIIRRISRQHAVILRSRVTHAYALRPLPGNTGTQLETTMLQAQQDYPLRPGHRIILGGVIRLKFEIA